ncbi:hypothetical protein MBELCI_0001 [Limimaricola cinnabarinus LL-001]|uniref:Uncharacterized protein n=1 Tax=Limimaricola cinnabarinus LL-001 TaxID=1337093 RepID=U3A8G0_9RHOB|nr:hypothetical protein MBELCI_0001 [Limimaricola cinnabarinus LL-001]
MVDLLATEERSLCFCLEGLSALSQKLRICRDRNEPLMVGLGFTQFDFLLEEPQTKSFAQAPASP